MKFTRGSRLSGQAEYGYVFARPRVTSDACFKILRRANDQGHCRLGLAVSRKVSRKAVGRNRLKRIIRESFRAHQEKLAKHGGWDIVVLPNARAATICNSELNRLLEAHWQKIKNERKNTDHG